MNNSNDSCPIYSDQELLDYADDLLPASRAKEIEESLRYDQELRVRLNELLQRVLTGNHSIGDVWREYRISCPGRNDWGRYLLRLVSPAELDYFQFHLNVVKCSLCQANLDDLIQLKEQLNNNTTSNTKSESLSRQQRIFESSKGMFHKDSSP